VSRRWLWGMDRERIGGSSGHRGDADVLRRLAIENGLFEHDDMDDFDEMLGGIDPVGSVGWGLNLVAFGRN